MRSSDSTTRGWRAGRIRLFALLAATVLAHSGTHALAATGCNLPPSPCSATSCAGGCAFALFAVSHFSAGVCTIGGAFDLSATRYRSTCSGLDLGGGPMCSGPYLLPPLRFWDYDDYQDAGGLGANSGCQIREPVSMRSWIVNFQLDAGGPPETAGHWFLYQAAWKGAGVDGCPTRDRTVVEISDVDDDAEGTTAHSAWYLLASVDARSGYDFDRIRGAPGCTEATVPPVPVPAVRLSGRTEPCVGAAAVTEGADNPVDPSFMDVTVEISDSAGAWYTEAGANGVPELIAGFQLVYASGTEPTTSRYAAGSWSGALDPIDPTRLAPWLPVGRTAAIVALPRATAPHWLAARVVYRAGGFVNPERSSPDGPGPLVTSPVGPHCGPVAERCVPVVPTGTVLNEVRAVRRAPADVELTWTDATVDPPRFLVFRTSDVTRLVETETGIGGEEVVADTTATTFADVVAIDRPEDPLCYEVLPADSCGRAVFP